MTELWRYTAIDMAAPANLRRGELAGASAAEVRASLRRIGLQVTHLRPLGHRTRIKAPRQLVFVEALVQTWHKYLRSRRRSQRAEVYDSLSTMLLAGLPLLEAVQTLIDSNQGGKRAEFASGVLVHIREQLRSGRSLGQAMREHPSWFDSMDVAIVEAGQHAGTLPGLLESMALRQEKANELGGKLIGALAYPFMVLTVGLGVVVFLSVKTLPELTKILSAAHIPAPELTVRVMWVGQMLAHHWIVISGIVGLILIAALIMPALLRQHSVELPKLAVAFISRLRGPKVLRTLAVGNVALGLAELIRSGVPMVDALRVLGPTAGSARLAHQLQIAAGSIERGDELAAALADHRWFDAEFRRLLDIGQASGELDVMLDRIGQRYQRQARRSIDRLATLLEPCVILSLAVLVGIVVMAAILPLLRLQEII